MLLPLGEMKATVIKAARWTLVGLSVLFLVLYVVFALIYPLPEKLSTCSCKHSVNYSCDLGNNSSIYTGSNMVITSTYNASYNLGRNHTLLTYELSVVPNSHVCIYYCFQGDVSSTSVPTKEDYQPILMPASPDDITSITVVYSCIVLLCVGMLVAACIGARPLT